MIGAICVLLLIIVLLARGAYRSFLRMTGQQEKPPAYYGPKPTAEDTARYMEWLEGHIRRFPDGAMANSYPDIRAKVYRQAELEEIAAEYHRLDKEYRSGRISKADYEAAIDELSLKLDINDLENHS